MKKLKNIIKIIKLKLILKKLRNIIKELMYKESLVILEFRSSKHIIFSNII